MHLVLCAVSTPFTRLDDDKDRCHVGTWNFAIWYFEDKALLSYSCIPTWYEELSNGLSSKYQLAMYQRNLNKFHEGPLINAHYPAHLFQNALVAVGKITSLDGTPTLSLVA